MEPSIRTVVMAHPSREKWFGYLKEKLGEDVSFIIDHNSDGVWPNARRAWGAFDPDIDYHVVIQDDAIICENFYEELKKHLSPKWKAYGLYWGKQPRSLQNAAHAKIEQGYIIRERPLWGVGVVLATDIIPHMLEWTGEKKWPSRYKNIADDTRICKYLRKHKHKIYYPLPSLLDHRTQDNPTLTNVDKEDRSVLYFIDSYTPKKKNMRTVEEIKNNYVGEAAEEYEEKRKKQKLWEQEHKFVSFHLPESGKILDVPVGTGRFFPLYKEKNLDCVGIDISQDMIEIATQKGFQAELIQADALPLPLEDNSVDMSVVVRFLFWMNREELRKMMEELFRVTRNDIIASIWLGKTYNQKRKNKPITHTEKEWESIIGNREFERKLIHSSTNRKYWMYKIKC